MMKTLTLNQQNMIRRVLLLLLLVAAFSVMFIFTAKPVDAADESTYTVSGKYVTNNDVSSELTNVERLPANLKATTFYLYKVGSFSRDSDGNAILVLQEPYQNITDVNVNINKDAEKYKNSDGTINEVAWTKDWLAEALTMSNYVTEATPDYTTSAVATSDATQFTFTGVTNGLYLLTGTGTPVNDYPEAGDMAYWSPQPMFVLVWNGSVTLNVKPQIEPYVYKLRVDKQWAGDEKVKDLARPDSVEVKLSYDKVLWKTVTLGKQTDGTVKWSYEWETQKGMHDPTKWTIEETIEGKIAANYVPSYTENFIGTQSEDGIYSQDNNGNTKDVTITNTYERYKLKLTKTMEVYVNHGEDLSTSLVFELTSKEKDAAGKPLYHKVVGMPFDATSGQVKSIYINNIPRNVQTIIVKEVYSGNLDTEDREKECTLGTFVDESGAEQKGFAVQFDNTYDNKTHLSGIINKYEAKDGAYKFKTREGYSDTAQ